MLSDRGRIITSASIRRLQTKAQVFSLEQNAAVRSRLTHTMEVSFIGELLAAQTFERLRDQEWINEKLHQPFSTVVQNACLLHDLGNPPFGHLGEAAIGNWFARDNNKTEIMKYWDAVPDNEAHYQSFVDFDGNPQALRIVTRLRWLNNEYGLNLSYTLLASFLKYLSAQKNSDKPFQKKIGFFQTESDIIKETWKVLGLKTHADGMPAQRHPLVFLMEAADDIAYCSSDIEDALEKGVTTEQAFFEELLEGDLVEGVSLEEAFCALSDSMKKVIENARNYRSYRKENYDSHAHSPNALFVTFKVHLTNCLVRKAVESYVSHHQDILEGNFHEPLLENEAVLNALTTFSHRHIYSSKEAVNVEMSGYHILQSILDSFKLLMVLDSSTFGSLQDSKKRPLEKRLYSLLSQKHICSYFHEVQKQPSHEPMLRTRLIVDYLSGMTDSHAAKTFGMLKGITG